MKGPTTATGESAISIRVQAILGTAHRMQNPVSNAQSRQGEEWGRFYGPNLKFNRCLGRHGSRTRHPSTERSSTVPYRDTQRFNNESVNKEKDEMGVLQEGIARAWTRRSDFDSAQVIDTI